MSELLSFEKQYNKTSRSFQSFNKLLYSVIKEKIAGTAQSDNFIKSIQSNNTSYSNYKDVINLVVNTFSDFEAIRTVTPDFCTMLYDSFTAIKINDINFTSVRATINIIYNDETTYELSNVNTESYFSAFVILQLLCYYKVISNNNITSKTIYAAPSFDDLKSIFNITITTNTTVMIYNSENINVDTSLNTYSKLIQNNPHLLTNSLYQNYSAGSFNASNTEIYIVFKDAINNTYTHEKLNSGITISHSMQRQIVEMPSAGKTGNNIKAYGTRKIAGTIELSDPSSGLITNYANRIYSINQYFSEQNKEMNKDLLKFVKGTNLYPDQFPPFHIYSYSIPENGAIGYILFKAIYGIRIVGEGVVTTEMDNVINKTWEFIAEGFEPDILLAIDSASFSFYLSAFDQLSEVRSKDYFTPRINF
jgi:hypothetical protein